MRSMKLRVLSAPLEFNRLLALNSATSLVKNSVMSMTADLFVPQAATGSLRMMAGTEVTSMAWRMESGPSARMEYFTSRSSTSLSRSSQRTTRLPTGVPPP